LFFLLVQQWRCSTGANKLAVVQAKKLLAKKKAAAKKTSSSASANLAAREAKERAAKKTKVKDKKNYNQVNHAADKNIRSFGIAIVCSC